MFGMTSGADWLIAGLGTPEPKYDGTRHNAGFEALDYLAAQWHCDIAKAKWQGLYGTAQVGDHAFTAAGSTIGHDVPAGALSIERAKQTEIDNWGENKLQKYIAKKQKLEADKKNK